MCVDTKNRTKQVYTKPTLKGTLTKFKSGNFFFFFLLFMRIIVELCDYTLFVSIYSYIHYFIYFFYYLTCLLACIGLCEKQI